MVIDSPKAAETIGKFLGYADFPLAEKSSPTSKFNYAHSTGSIATVTGTTTATDPPLNVPAATEPTTATGGSTAQAAAPVAPGPARVPAAPHSTPSSLSGASAPSVPHKPPGASTGGSEGKSMPVVITKRDTVRAHINQDQLVIVVGLPKSGTNRLFTAFAMAGLKTANFQVCDYTDPSSLTQFLIAVQPLLWLFFMQVDDYDAELCQPFYPVPHIEVGRRTDPVVWGQVHWSSCSDV